VDPEATRRSHIGRTQSQIAMLEEQVETAGNELARTEAATRQELERYGTEKWQDVKQVMATLARAQAKWCRKNLVAWEEALDEVERMK